MIHMRGTLWLAFITLLIVACNAPPPPVVSPLPITTVDPISTIEDDSSPTDSSATNGDSSTQDGSSTNDGVSTDGGSSADDNAVADDSIADNDVYAVLPAPIYFIGEVSQQVMRLERDGVTIIQITDMSEPVTAFDYSVATDTLVTISNNKVIAWRDNSPTPLFDGGEIDPDDPDSFLRVVANPHISPDGTQVTFGYNGIRMATVDGSFPPSILFERPELPDFSDPNVQIPEEPIYFPYEAEYSPSGQQLLIHFGYFPEGGGIGLYDVETAEFTDLSQLAYESGGIGCCEFAWDANGDMGYIIGDVMIYGSPGLAHVNTRDLTVRGLISPENGVDASLKLFRSGHVTPEGDLLTFAGAAQFPGDGSFFELNRITPNGEQTRLGEEFYGLAYRDILWAEDGSGVLFSESPFGGRSDGLGSTRWVNVDHNTNLQLPLSGSNYVWGAAPQPTVSISAEAIEQLKARALADFALPIEKTVEGVAASPLLMHNQSAWLVYTTGGRSYDPEVDHHFGIYRYANGAWESQTRGNLWQFGSDEESISPDYIGPGSIQQVFVEPTNLWLLVTGGVGAHSGVLQLLRFDGTTFHEEATNFNGSPFAGYTEDLDGDGWQEVILDQTDPYIFCYACGVRLANYTVLRWDGADLQPLQLTTFEGESEEAIANNQAVTLAQANLWNDAEYLIQPYENSENPTVAWNAELILLTASGRAAYTESPYPLITRMFYGDYAGATFAIGDLTPAEIFDINGPLIAGTPAEGWSDFMLPQIVDFSTQALNAQPDNAGAYFLRGWATYLLNPNDPLAISDVQRSAELQPDHYLYPVAAAFLSNP